MASTSGVSVPTYSPPATGEASGVLAEIQGQVGNINNLFAMVQQLLAEIQALEPPRKADFELKDANGKTIKDANGNPTYDTAAFKKAMDDFRRKLDQLNQKLEATYRKLGEAQVLLQHLQQQKLPEAERRDAQRLQDECKRAMDALGAAAQAIQQAGETDPSQSANAADQEFRLRVRNRDLPIAVALKDGTSLKSLVHAFSVMALVVGTPTTSTPYVTPPSTPGTGLPPMGTL